MNQLFVNMICLVLIASPVALVSCASGNPTSKKSSTELVEIHVNQVALDKHGVKRAVVVTDQGSELSRVVILPTDNSMATEIHNITPSNFTEWESGRMYYEVNFDSFNHSGTYNLEVSLKSGEISRSSDILIADNALFDLTTADVLTYFTAGRNTSERDRAIPTIDTGELIDVYGGWNDAGGETGKYLSHLTYSNFFTPQQGSFIVWSLFASFEAAEIPFARLGLTDALLDEAFWGADYLHRLLSKEGYFYMTVFDRWGSDENRWITGYKGLDGEYTPNYQAAFREGGGVAIAALAKAYRVAVGVGRSGEFPADQYLADAVRAFDHLVENNVSYCDDGKENIIDDYTALMAAVELFRATGEERYLGFARDRADQLQSRLSDAGYFIADGGQRPYFHAVEAGLPVISLLRYIEIETDMARRQSVLLAVRKSLQYQLLLNSEVANPFGYPRQNFQTFDFDNQVYTSGVLSGFFVPHENETGYWWQGENARLASLTAAATLAIKHFDRSDNAGLRSLARQLEVFAQANLDWIMGKNPYDLCMMYGHGYKNPEFQVSGGAMVKGGISNGITGKMENAEGRGIDWLAADEHGNWRWVEQWTPHDAWFLYASSIRAK